MQVAPSIEEVSERISRLRTLFEGALPRVVEVREPRDLYEPVAYVLESKGKRFRPLLVMLTAEVFGARAEDALPAALAVEIFHNFTLVHDDIMDHAPTRRGRPTVHVRWDESTAILAGDLLQALAYDQLASTKRGDLPRILHAFSAMVALLCEGQTLDKLFESRADVSVADYLHMIDRKTAALIQHSLELGGLVGGATDEQLDILRRIGLHIGRAFQIQDDLLDLIADDVRWGKLVGGDLIEGKKTFLLLHAIEQSSSEDRAWFMRIVTEKGLPVELIGEARQRMERAGILKEAADAVIENTRAANALLDRLPPGVPVETLRWLFQRMEARVH